MRRAGYRQRAAAQLSVMPRDPKMWQPLTASRFESVVLRFRGAIDGSGSSIVCSAAEMKGHLSRLSRLAVIGLRSRGADGMSQARFNRLSTHTVTVAASVRRRTPAADSTELIGEGCFQTGAGYRSTSPVRGRFAAYRGRAHRVHAARLGQAVGAAASERLNPSLVVGRSGRVAAADEGCFGERGGARA